MRKGLVLMTVGALGWLAAMAAAWGGVTYDAAQGILLVSDYPEESPARPADLLAADQRQGWGIVRYDATADVYQVPASLWIGTTNDLGTFFQIGSPDRPRETVVVQGNVCVRPAHKSLRRPDGRYAIVNRLTLGHPSRPEVKAALKIASKTPGQYGLGVGQRDDEGRLGDTCKGELHVYHSAITAALPDAQHVYNNRAAGEWHATDVRLVNADISWFGGVLCYGIAPVCEGTVFHHGDTGFENNSPCCRRCVFHHIGGVLAPGSAGGGLLAECVFTNNGWNWKLGGMSANITLIDCDVGQTPPLRLMKNTMTPIDAQRFHLPFYPSILDRRTLVVKVVDTQGQPVPEALVNVTCSEDPEAVSNGSAFTGREGCTLGKGEPNAMLVTRRRWQATDDPNQPQLTSFRLVVSVWKKGFQPVVMPVTLPDGPLTITLNNDKGR